MGGVATAPLAELAQGDAVGVVSLALVRLVVAPLAVLAGEGYSDAHVSAGHLGGLPGRDTKERPAGGRSDRAWYYGFVLGPGARGGIQPGHLHGGVQLGLRAAPEDA